MAVNSKTGKIVKPRTLGQKLKSATTRRSNKTSGRTKPKTKRK